MTNKIIYNRICGCGKEFETQVKLRKRCETCYPYQDNTNKIVTESHLKFNETNINTWVECPICAFRAGDLGTHYRLRHSLERGHGLPTKSKDNLDRMLGKDNPGYQHGGKLSPWSDKSEKHSKDVRELAMAKANKGASDNSIRKPKYWVDKGYSEEEAKGKVTWYQSRNLDWFIHYYGIEEGTIRWKAKTENWVATMDAKSDEEKSEINVKKMWRGGTSSKAEHELYENIKVVVKNIESTVPIITGNRTCAIVDMRLENKIIEYFGDYWHCNPQKYHLDFYNKSAKKSAEEIWEHNYTRYKLLVSQGYEILIIWEKDFKLNRDETIKKCITFLTQ